MMVNLKMKKSSARAFNVQSNVQTAINTTSSSVTPNLSVSSTPPRKPPSCVICQGQHLLHTCKQFLDMSPEGRVACVRQHGLCLNCLFPKHSARMCRKDNMCKKGCRLKHSSFLHEALAGRYRTNSVTPSSDVVSPISIPDDSINPPGPDTQQ